MLQFRFDPPWEGHKGELRSEIQWFYVDFLQIVCPQVIGRRWQSDLVANDAQNWLVLAGHSPPRSPKAFPIRPRRRERIAVLIVWLACCVCTEIPANFHYFDAIMALCVRMQITTTAPPAECTQTFGIFVCRVGHRLAEDENLNSPSLSRRFLLCTFSRFCLPASRVVGIYRHRCCRCVIRVRHSRRSLARSVSLWCARKIAFRQLKLN